MVSDKQHDLITEVPTNSNFDIIIIGGGIYGVMLAYEASKQGKKVLVLEKNRFGSHTSSNSLRIIHGGLRYLQTLDVKRFFESVSERRWFLKTFPKLIFPLTCLMPLYSKGVHRPIILNVALVINDLLSHRRNRELPLNKIIPDGKIISPKMVVQLFPGVDQNGLTGGAVWTDAFMPDPISLFQNIIDDTRKNGGVFFEGVEATGLLTKDNTAVGVKAVSSENRKEILFSGKVVINAAGPWCRKFSQKFDKDIPDLFHPSLAWNILFNRPALSKTAIAVKPPGKGSKTYFILPLNEKLFVGTGHGAWNISQGIENPCPNADQVQNFISDLNRAIPGLALDQNEIETIFSGLLPAKKEGMFDIKCRETIIEHGCHIKNVFSVSGVKFTTSRLVAQKVLDKIYL